MNIYGGPRRLGTLVYSLCHVHRPNHHIGIKRPARWSANSIISRFSICVNQLKNMDDPLVAFDGGVRRSRRIQVMIKQQFATSLGSREDVFDANHKKTNQPRLSKLSEERKKEATKKRRTTRAPQSSILSSEEGTIEPSRSKPKRTKTKRSLSNDNKTNDSKTNDNQTIVLFEGLGRTREREIQKEKQVEGSNSNTREIRVLGVDEAGRGPLAGPVVAAAIILPSDCDTIPGVVDSKKLTKEEDREEVYERITTLPNVRWAVSVIDAARIDEINILQATLEGMRMAVTALTTPTPIDGLNCVNFASIQQEGCYVVCSSYSDMEASSAIASRSKSNDKEDKSDAKMTEYYALIDGNKVPVDMPCEAESIIKGDSKECCIAAASIIAKVTRDRLMHGYHALYPHYNLKQHKGYPTAAHMAAVREHGASAIHRRTFAPLKHMTFDVDGNVIEGDKC